MKSYLKYPGNKKWLGDFFQEQGIIDKVKRYNLPVCAPFCGALGDLLLLQPQKVKANDIYTPLINLHNHVKVAGFEITIPFRYSEYYKNREHFNQITSDPSFLHQPAIAREAAEYFYYLNRVGYNGLIRASKNGLNVPVGKPAKEMDWRSLQLDLDFKPYQKIIRNWEFTCQDFAQIKLTGDELILADPPYDGCFNNYTNAFTWEDQERLLDWLIASKCPFILFNAGTERIEEIYRQKGLNIFKVQRTRTISQKSRNSVIEIIAKNFV